MGMNVGNNSGEDDVLVDMNTTPLIDVMLVLLIMFIITIPIQLHSVNMNMPPASNVKPPIEPDIVKIDINEASQIFWNGEMVANRDELKAKMVAAAALPIQPEIHLRPNKLARYEIVAYVMAASQRAGLVKMGILGHEQFL
ncbi:MAG: biopolymer transporter ExbD [Casimicrobium sp.]